MTNRNYQRGRALEYSVQHKLESLGYVTMRFVGSHPPIDVVASSGGKGKILCIQCKSGSSPFSGRDGAFLVQWANFFKGYPILVQRQRRKTFWYLLERGQFLPIEDAWLSELETIAV